MALSRSSHMVEELCYFCLKFLPSEHLRPSVSLRLGAHARSPEISSHAGALCVMHVA